MATKKQLEAQLAVLQGAPAAATMPAAPAAIPPAAIPAWAAGVPVVAAPAAAPAKAAGPKARRTWSGPVVSGSSKAGYPWVKYQTIMENGRPYQHLIPVDLVLMLQGK